MVVVVAVEEEEEEGAQYKIAERGSRRFRRGVGAPVRVEVGGLQ